MPPLLRTQWSALYAHGSLVTDVLALVTGANPSPPTAAFRRFGARLAGPFSRLAPRRLAPSRLALVAACPGTPPGRRQSSIVDAA